MSKPPKTAAELGAIIAKMVGDGVRVEVHPTGGGGWSATVLKVGADAVKLLEYQRRANEIATELRARMTWWWNRNDKGAPEGGPVVDEGRSGAARRAPTRRVGLCRGGVALDTVNRLRGQAATLGQPERYTRCLVAALLRSERTWVLVCGATRTWTPLERIARPARHLDGVYALR